MFVAINYISCLDSYKERFEHLFSTRAKAIDLMPGFIDMMVLKPSDAKEEYLIVSHWEKEQDFKDWTGSPAFIDGHKRGFEDVRIARESGLEPPMRSSFKTYTLITK
jgi:heme oxygenase (mycobilin-producing)